MKFLYHVLGHLQASGGLLRFPRVSGKAQAFLPIAAGPLRVHPKNSRYFTDDGRRAVYLTGSHTWQNLQDGGRSDARDIFDYTAFLDFLVAHNHNFFRLWTWESSLGSAWYEGQSRVRPMIYLRTGPGMALDGKPRFDLSQFDPAYFRRLHDRVEAARDRGIYVGVMLFQGFSVAKKSIRAHGNPWPGHPFHRANNINGVDGDLDGDGNGYEVHTLDNPRITAIQEAYVRKVIDAVGQFDNVIFEISNESHGASTPWQCHMIDLIRECERGTEKRHPVWMSFQFDETMGAGDNRTLFASRADAISPGQDEVNRSIYRSDPPVADGSKVILLDTDHLWGIGGDVDWVWKTFTRGMHPLFMDPYRKKSRWPFSNPDIRWHGVRQAMGATLRLACRIDLAAMAPSDDPAHCSTRYCLRDPGVQYVVYQPREGSFTVQVEAGTHKVEWIAPVTGRVKSVVSMEAGSGLMELTPPRAGSWVLLLSSRTAA